MSRILIVPRRSLRVAPFVTAAGALLLLLVFGPMPARADTAPTTGTFVTAPSVTSGTRQVGKVMSATFPAWTPTPATESYQWLRGGAAIAGATHATYDLSGADLGQHIAVSITGSRTGYQTTSVTTNVPGVIARASSPSLRVKPVIRGVVRDGHTLGVSTGTWSVPALTYSFSWYRSGQLVTNATTNHYALSGWDTGKTITARVEVKKTGYGNALAQATVTPPVHSPSAAFSGEGVYSVGTPGGVPVGTFYMQPIPNQGSCILNRLRTATGGTNPAYSIYSNGQVMVTVTKADKYWLIRECGPWYAINTAGPARASIGGDGMYKIASQLVPGTYRTNTTTGSSCVFDRLSDGNETGVIEWASGNSHERSTVVIKPTDYAFETERCGSWTKIH
jgi:hypothetical protein